MSRVGKIEAPSEISTLHEQIVGEIFIFTASAGSEYSIFPLLIAIPLIVTGTMFVVDALLDHKMILGIRQKILDHSSIN